MKIEKLLARRTDLSTFLVHLTRSGSDGDTAKSRLINILASGIIEARSAFGSATPRLVKADMQTNSQNCVCFTETPMEHVHVLAEQIDDRSFKFEPYGIAIPKLVGRRRGINPIWYIDITPGHDWLNQPLEKMIDEQIKSDSFVGGELARLTPFIEHMGTSKDQNGTGSYKKEFWWEREWRINGDFKLPDCPIILCPSDDMEEIQQSVENSTHLKNPSFVDPRWSLEQIIGRLAGFSHGDLGAF